MTFKLGLTGSIGMGKSTTAGLFEKLGCAVWDADAAVHRLYAKDGAAVAEFAKRFPNAIEDGAISRPALKALIDADASVLKNIERIVHPLVRADRELFLQQTSADIAVLDIPLLFETNSQSAFDAVACVFVSNADQKRRVLERGTMSEEQFKLIRSKQMPIEEKLRLSDYQIETDTLDHAEQQVAAIVAKIRGKLNHA